MFCLVSWVIISSDNRLLLVEAIASERFGNGIHHFQKLGFSHSKGIGNMSSFKNACMAFVALAILAHWSASGGIVINVWQDGANVRSHSDGGTLDYTALTYLDTNATVYNSRIQTNYNTIGVGGLQGNQNINLAFYGGNGEITQTGFFGDGGGGFFADIATGPEFMVFDTIQITDGTVVNKIGTYGAMDATWLNLTMSDLGFIASPPTTTYKWGAFGANETVTVLFSAPVPEIDPAGMGSVLALVAGALGLLERRRLKTA